MKKWNKLVFLRNRAEVISMSIFEFDEEREMKLIREEEYQSGLEEGIIITLYNLYKDNTISLKKAAKEASVTEEQFLDLVKYYRLD